MDSDKPLRSAVIGAGYLGKFHAEKFAAAKQSQLVAVVDVQRDKATEVASRFEAQGLTDYRELPALNVQCASIVSNTPTHFEIAKWLLSNGVDILIEKPMTTSAVEAQQLIELAEANQRILQVGHLERFNPAFQAMKEKLHRPLYFEVRRIAPFKGRGTEVDVVLDMMIHDIDLVCHLVDRDVLKVEAIGVPVLTETADVASCRVTFDGGAVANFSASRAAFKTERTMRIFQPNVYVSLDFGAKSLKIYSRNATHDPNALPEINANELQLDSGDALQAEITSFLNCVQNRSRPEVTGEDGLRALQLVELIHEAFEESRQRIEHDSVQPIHLSSFIS